MLAAGPAALAHGGGTPQLTNQPAGDYLVSAWTTPDPATIGTLHVTVALQNASSGEPVTDASVQVVAHPLEGDSAEIAMTATRDDALTPYFYEADLTIPDAGLWQIELALVKAEGAAAERLGFVLEIKEQSPNWILWGLIGVALIVAAWVGWLLLSGGRRRGSKARPG